MGSAGPWLQAKSLSFSVDFTDAMFNLLSMKQSDFEIFDHSRIDPSD